MANSESAWTWSAQHNDYYRCTYENGQAVYHWAKEGHNAQSSQDQTGDGAAGRQYGEVTAYQGGHDRNDSVADESTTMPDPLPTHVRQNIPNLMPGTPDRGWIERLDDSYCMRTKLDARRFFVKGRVFSMLWAESASETWAKSGTVNTAITVGRFGQGVFSQIRRFVIVEVKRGFVYAIGIFTYGDRGTLKPGCVASEHAAAYFSGSAPYYLPGEEEAGLIKEPIEITPANSTEMMKPTSRIRFGKTFPIEWNVKVKDIGQVVPAHMSRLLRYWKDEDRSDDTNNAESEYNVHSGDFNQNTVPRQVPQSQVVVQQSYYDQQQQTSAYGQNYQNQAQNYAYAPQQQYASAYNQTQGYNQQPYGGQHSGYYSGSYAGGQYPQ